MENRRPTTGEAGAARGTHRMRWLLLAAGVLVILLVLVATARLFAPGDADPWRDRGAQTVGQSTPAAQAPADEGELQPRPALIIDAATEPARQLRDTPLAAIQPASGGSAESPAGDPLATRAQEATAANPAAGAGPRRASAAAPARSARRSADAESDSNLISTLLGIIRQDGGAEAAPSSMDSLVARILAENERTHSETSAALASLGQPQPAQAEAAAPTRAQRELQACPAANTVQGINCRDHVCARWAGRDPACPAR